MSVTRVGSTKQFADNWENIFGGRKARKSGSKSDSTNARGKKAAKEKGAKKKAKKKAKK